MRFELLKNLEPLTHSLFPLYATIPAVGWLLSTSYIRYEPKKSQVKLSHLGLLIVLYAILLTKNHVDKRHHVADIHSPIAVHIVTPLVKHD